MDVACSMDLDNNIRSCIYEQCTEMTTLIVTPQNLKYDIHTKLSLESYQFQI